MSRALAVDTATWWGGVALVERDGTKPSRVVAEIGLEVVDSHSHRLLGWVDYLLEQAGWSRRELDVFAAARGPGSFTGIRIGLGTVRGLALAADRPAFGVGTLDAMAEAYGSAEVRRIALLGAGRGETYGAVFDPTSSPPEPDGPPWLGPTDEAIPTLAAGRAAVAFGSGTPVVVTNVPSVRIGGTPRGTAAAVGRVALALMQSGVAFEDTLAPLYVRPPDALLARRPS